MGKDVIIACDFAEKTEVLDFLSSFTDRKPFIKIGMELFYAEGADIVRELKRRGHKIFLDLKLHDIPNTVKKTMRVLSALDIDMCNVHAGGKRRFDTRRRNTPAFDCGNSAYFNRLEQFKKRIAY